MRAPAIHILAKLCAALTALLMWGCAAPSYVVLLGNPDGSSSGAISISNATDTIVVRRVHQGVLLGAALTPIEVTATQIAHDFSAARAAQPMAPVSHMLFFESGSVRMVNESIVRLPQLAAQLRSRGVAALTIVGHADTVGGDALNDRLGLLRAQEVERLLRGADFQVLEWEVRSRGRRELLVPTPENVSHPDNRRVEVRIR